MPLLVSLSQLHHRHKCLLPVSPSFDYKSRQRPRSLPLPKSPSRSTTTSSAVQNISSADTDDFTNYSGYLFNGTDSDSLTDYDIYKIYARYQKKPLVFLRRLYQTVTTLGKWFAFTYLDAITVRSSSMFPIRAAELRRILVELGPAYVKIAQALSSRPDLLPQSYLDELSLLQDQIAPFPTAVAYVTIEQDLKVSLEDIFSEISLAPVAAASLGQVYKARLRDSGKLVAVKVQRPGVQAAISLDILILRFLAGLIMKVGKLNTDLQAVVDEWASSLFREMDYRIEAKNGLKFRGDMSLKPDLNPTLVDLEPKLRRAVLGAAHTSRSSIETPSFCFLRELYGSLQDVLVPEMVLDKTTSRVLVIEWVEGKKLSEVRDLHIIEVGVYCSFNQLLECGFYHADPHPGNLLLTYDGKLAYLDFGMMGEFEQKLREGFIEACLHLINQDFKALSKDFVTLGLLPPTAEKEAVTKALTGVFESAVSKGVGNISFGDLLADLGRTMYKFKFRIPSYFTLVIRSLAVLEGIAISFDPSYKVLGSTYPWIARKVLTDSSPQLQSTLKGLLYRDSVFRIDRLESLLSESLRVNTETRSVSRLPGDRDPQVLAKQMLVFLLQKEGAFLREILLEELAKGLDALGLATMESMKFASYRALPFAPSVSFSYMNEDDRANLRTFYRLLLLLSRFQKTEKSTEIGPHSINKIESEDMALMLYQLVFSREIIPILYVVSELSQEEQWYLLSLPPDLAAKLISRIAARTLRRLFLQ